MLGIMPGQASIREKTPSGGDLGVATSPDRSALSRLEVLGLALLAALVYVLLGQRTFYREDGYQLIHHMLSKGQLYHDIHPLYLPALQLAQVLLSWTGRGAHGIGTLLSAISVAGALFFLGLTARRAIPGRSRELLFLGLVAFCPAVAFFATVVEFHGFFFLFVGLAFLAAEGLIQSQCKRVAVGSAILLGLATALGTAAHATGQLLVPLLWAWVVGRRGSFAPWRALLLFTGIHVLVYFGGLALVLAVLGIGGQSQAAGSLGHLQRWLGQGLVTATARFPGQLWWEIVFPYLPLSLLPLLLILPGERRARPSRLQVLAVLTMFLPYLLLVVLTLADEFTGEAIWERGAYLLPLAPPAAWALARARLPLSWLTCLLLGGVILSVAQIRQHDERPGRALAQEVRAITDGQPILAFVGPVESIHLYPELPEVRQGFVLDLLTSARPLSPEAICTLGDGMISEAFAKGRRVLMTRRAHDLMAGSETGEIGKRLAEMKQASPLLHAHLVTLGRAWLAHLQQHYHLTPVPDHPDFFELTPP